MPEQERKPEQGILAELFAPGNLVWGKSGGIENIVLYGILPPKLRNRRSFALRADSVCFSLLKTRTNILSTYNNSSSSLVGYGPRYDDSLSERATSIIVNREKILQRYPRRVFAIGSQFHEAQLRIDYNFSEQDSEAPLGKVFNIPIALTKYNELEPFWDEVVIRFEDASPANALGVTSDCWKGFVTQEQYGTTLLETLRETGLTHLPIVSPQGKILYRGNL